MVSCGLIEADYGGSLKHSVGPFLIHEGDQNQTAHAQYRYKSNDIIMTYLCIHYSDKFGIINEGGDRPAGQHQVFISLLLFYSAVITSAQSRTLAGRCLHGYEAHCYMNSIHVCPNIDHAMACE